MTIAEKISNATAESALFETGYVNMDTLRFSPEIRQICEQNSCRCYGTTWACPPAVGTLSECKARVMQYENMLLFSKKYDLEDSFDFEGMTAGLHHFKKTVDTFQTFIDDILSEYLLLSNEGCGRCKTCTYPDASCRFPAQLHHALEGYGFSVNELAAQAGIRYNNGPNTVTFFGALLFNDN